LFPPLYAILDAESLPPENQEFCLALAESLAGGGVTLIQYRGKNQSARAVFETGCRLSSLLSAKGAKLILNDRPDVAVLCGAAGVHVGQDDLGVEQARAVCGPSRWVGVSTHNLAQLRAADATSADYVAIGPIFTTATKKNPDPVVGLEFVRQARRLTQKPLVAIGGITLDNAPDVWRAGADSVAVIKDLLAGPSPADRAKQYLAIAGRVGKSRS
jgi:thiamine-phosphate pyrophosphorylase